MQSGILAKQDTGVVTTKAETVTHGDIHVASGSRVRRVIEIAIRIGRCVVDGGCDQ